jgi:hypothetical protein
VEAADYQIAGGALDLKLGESTWLSFEGVTLKETLRQKEGVFELNFGGTPPPPPLQATTIRTLDYGETRVGMAYNYIWHRDWFLQAQYQFSRSDLAVGMPNIPATPSFQRVITSQADLDEIRLAGMWQHPRGFFARTELWWFAQELGGSTTQPPGDSFPELNEYVGYRFPNRRVDLTVGLLNLTGGDYHLSPLNYYLDMPHERLFYARLRFNF